MDNFHTCFVLKNLAQSLAADRATRIVRERCFAGTASISSHLLDDSGLPIPFAERPRMTLHRRDLYDYAEGINLAHLVRELVPDGERGPRALTTDLVERWQLPDGHFVTRELAIGRNKVPYHRWAQSQAFRSLARLSRRSSQRLAMTLLVELSLLTFNAA